MMAAVLSLIAACSGGSGGTPDTTAPTVISGPLVDAARNQVIAEFSEVMNAATIDTSTFLLEDNVGTPVAGAVSYSGVTAVFTPNSQLANSADYTATIITGAQDLAGNAVVTDVSWSITTASGNIQISWNGNLETAVNSAGGGYKVYYSANSSFDPGDGGVTEIPVPWTSGPTAPTSILIPLSPGTYYLRIAAYSALNAPGSFSGSTSTTTPQMTLIAP
jgi:hypothetical protein